jgi:AcrR family transcriptional regulator
MPKKTTVPKKPRRRASARSANSAIDERVQRSKEIVLRVTSELLTEGGLGGVSVDEVSRRSGVAKTTIYRHWRTRSDLFMDACSQMAAKPKVPDTGSFEGDLTALLMSIAEMLRAARWPAVMPSIIDAAERDPEIARVHGRIQIGHSAPFHEIIKRAKRNGEISANADSAAMTATLLGPLYYRRWFSREPLDDKFVKGVIKNAIAECAAN